MQESTTIRVSRGTRDDIRNLAADDGVTLDHEIQRLVRAERQRRMGLALAAADLDDADRAWIDVGAHTVAYDARR